MDVSVGVSAVGKGRERPWEWAFDPSLPPTLTTHDVHLLSPPAMVFLRRVRAGVLGQFL
jgi:hypothetical protein